MAKVWMGSVPAACDVCQGKITTVFVDGRTKMGPWACMCPGCHKRDGVGLGGGKGQQYTYKPSIGTWEKTGG